MHLNPMIKLPCEMWHGPEFNQEFHSVGDDDDVEEEEKEEEEDEDNNFKHPNQEFLKPFRPSDIHNILQNEFHINNKWRKSLLHNERVKLAAKKKKNQKPPPGNEYQSDLCRLNHDVTTHHFSKKKSPLPPPITGDTFK